MKTNYITLKILALIILNDVGDTAAQAFMKQGLVFTGVSSVNFANLTEFLMRSIASPLLWLGILVFALNFFLWITILYKIDLSIAMPVGSFSYILVPVTAMIFFHERIEPLRWVGIALIVLGIHFVSRSRQRAKPGEPEDV